MDLKNAAGGEGGEGESFKRCGRGVSARGLVCVTGVSGSGKLTLVNDILLRAASGDLFGSNEKPGSHEEDHGLEEDRLGDRGGSEPYWKDAAEQSGDVHGDP